MLTLAFYHLSCVRLTAFCYLLCSVHREKQWPLLKNACKHTISEVFFDCHYTQLELFIWNFQKRLMALLNRRDKRGLKHCFLSWPNLKGLVTTLSHHHVIWEWRKNRRYVWPTQEKKKNKCYVLVCALVEGTKIYIVCVLNIAKYTSSSQIFGTVSEMMYSHFYLSTS